MRIYDISFYAAGFFILGVLAASLKLSFSIIAMAAALTAVLFLLSGYFGKSGRLFWLAGLSLFIIAGAFYYLWDNSRSGDINIVFDEKINFEGVIVKNPERGNQQKLTVELRSPYLGRVLVKLKNYPSFNYGDLIKLEGIIQKPEGGSYANYLAKEGIFGIVDYPKAEFVGSDHGSKIKSSLFSLKEKTISVFQRVLPPENAAFLAGITLGERAEFSKEFKEAMSESGTTHLVALSGYNITILVIAVAYVLSFFASRRLVFWLTLLIIIGFVAMTGAEASVVRAAIMGGIALLAKRANRLYSFRNAIVIAAFLMILDNPMVLSFDTGFQLSFMALLGIVYLQPAIKKFLKIKEGDDWSGFLAWKENLLTTLSAQLAVLPLLVLYFGNFSIVSLLSNILILSVIPLTMALGFILGFIGFISYELSLIFGWFVNLLLAYKTFIIKFFGGLNIFQISSLSIPLAIIYYFVLTVFILKNEK
ncbi:MAG: ComE operon protein 3 [Actinobacteria bacterium]|nr:ComE operon protein 3 [Actinomycetota bacterium]